MEKLPPRHGAKAAIAARRADSGEQVVRRIQALGTDAIFAIFIQTDVTQRAAVQAMVDATLSKFRRLDCAVNNSGIAVLNTNLKAVWLCMKYEIPGSAFLPRNHENNALQSPGHVLDRWPPRLAPLRPLRRRALFWCVSPLKT